MKRNLTGNPFMNRNVLLLACLLNAPLSLLAQGPLIYGYLSECPAQSAAVSAQKVEWLNRYHVNYVQFYDWQWKHHQPLAGTVGKPAESWKDIDNRTISRQTINDYIAACHAHGMKAMNYNLMNGAWSGYGEDGSGVDYSWGLWTKSNSTAQAGVAMPGGWATENIFFFNPANADWQNYIFGREKDVFSVYDFDGWHVDQTGAGGTVYDNDGKTVDLWTTFADFLNKAKTATGKRIIFNNVGAYGMFSVCNQTADDAVYVECWDGDGQRTYNDLKKIIDDGLAWGNGKPVVLAAYINRGKNSGSMNPPGVLLCDATIFASGGTHIELGDGGNMLHNEYFPNHDLKLDPPLADTLTNYYNFIVANKKWLYGGLANSTNAIELSIPSANVATTNKVWAFAKTAVGVSVLNLINLTAENNINWIDSDGTYPAPTEQKEFAVKYYCETSSVAHVRVASPDVNGGEFAKLDFKTGSDSEGDFVTFTVPRLEYWDMILVESAAQTSAQSPAMLTDGRTTATMSVSNEEPLRSYELTTDAPLRENRPAEKRIAFSEAPDHAVVRSGNIMFDGLYAMAVHEAVQNSVSEIKDNAYNNGSPIQLEAFQTGEFWTYVWTRDLSYSVYLALAQFDPQRAVNSLLFKTSVLKATVNGTNRNQIIQDTGSGGSYPVSSDRIVWALGADATLKYLPAEAQNRFLLQVYPILHDTIEQDRRLVFDPKDELYRGEQSFLDWREQTYPGWTKDNVLPIAMSKALSVNAANYFLLKTAAEYAGRVGQNADQARYAQWAENLKKSINNHFFDPEAELYSTYLLSDGVNKIRVHRYDLLGESLAILFGVADQFRVEAILKNYPVGPHGPAVVWPQEKSVPIYHNQAIWPFVTAYWIKAARQANNSAAVDLGVRSLQQQAAFNLSNMENFDFVTGLAEVKGQHLDGPVINSRRQLWSVAGYLSMVQDIVFGLETSWEGIRFRPFLTAKLRNETFAGSEQIELRNFNYRHTVNQIRLHLPPTNTVIEGVCPVSRIELNGKVVGENFVSSSILQSSNQWDIYLAAPKPEAHAPLRLVDVTNERARFSPAQPVWDEAQQGGITVVAGKLALHYQHSDAKNVVFNIYRDGELHGKAIPETDWVDTTSGDYQEHLYHYVVVAVDRISGNASHLTPPRFYADEHQQLVIPASDMQNSSGNLVANDHFENWGKSGDTLRTKSFEVERGGRYVINAKFSNGMGPVNTGITCAVKYLELRKTGSDAVLAAGYLIMPQSSDWSRWDMSSPVIANLVGGESYVISIGEDEYCRNMSCLKNNERYTAWPGGGETSCNYVNIAGLHLLQLQNKPHLSQARK